MAAGVEDSPIDWQKGLSQYGVSATQDEGMFHAFVEKFESDTFTQSIRAITEQVKAKNWPLVKREAHSLKGASGYSAATHCQLLCERLQYAAQEVPVNERKVLQAYNDLMQHAGDLQRYLCSRLKREFTNPDGLFDFRMPIAPKPIAVVVTSPTEQEAAQAKPVGENTEGQTGYTLQRLPPPTGKFISPITRQDSEYEEDDVNELDAYDELNKYWRCTLL